MTDRARKLWFASALSTFVALATFLLVPTTLHGDSAPTEAVTITVYFGGNSRATQERSVPFQANDSVMSATLRGMRTITNPEGTFIQSIEGVSNNAEQKEFWLYFVNGEAMHVGASETRLKPGDRVLWFLRRESSTKHEK